LPGDTDAEKYKLAVKVALRSILGESGAEAILFYIGEPNPDTFESKLRAILGNGSPLIIQEVKRQMGGSEPPKHGWLQGHR
jgi:hypothetical protein